MKKSARKAVTGTSGTGTDKLPCYEELSEWTGFKGFLGRGYQQAVPNPSIPLDRFISLLEEKLK
jgi:hypothetical protein